MRENAFGRDADQASFKQPEMGNLSFLTVAIGNLFPEMETWSVQDEVLFFGEIKPEPLRNKKVSLLRLIDSHRAKAVLTEAGRKSRVVSDLNLENVERILDRGSSLIAWSESGDLETVSEWGAKVVPLLAPNIGVWILEDGNPSQDERQMRLDMMEAWGLVSRKVSQRGRLKCFWYGRTEKNSRLGVDLTQKPYFEPILARSQKELRKQGWAGVDFSEAVEKCRQSRFPPRDLENIRLGLGVELLAPCGCRWHVDRNGGWERLFECSEGCEGEPNKFRGISPKTLLVGLNIPSSETGHKMACRICGSELLFDRVSEERGKVRSDLKCSHCGLISTKVIRADKIRQYKN